LRCVVNSKRDDGGEIKLSRRRSRTILISVQSAFGVTMTTPAYTLWIKTKSTPL